ncbi:hypothetical protein HDV05_005214 [Chytridiales sp. JEL 0842]|nr:hypothetical protein HDV05_005214 [Chytridiales sp. JEL 0842]
MALTLETSQILPFTGIVLSIYWYAAHRPTYIRGVTTELNIFPWAMQILAGFTWLNYSMHRNDVFIYLQNIPAFIVGFAVTFQWHPYLRKRTRKAHEMAMVAGLAVITLATMGTSVSPFIPPNVSRLTLGGLAGIMTLIHALAQCREVVRDVFAEDAERPPLSQFVLAGVGILFGGVWTAYGFFGAQDPFIYISNMIWAIYSIIHLSLLAYGAFRSGGLEMGWDTNSDTEAEDNMTVDRINRSSSRGSYASRSLPRSMSNRHSTYHEDEDIEVIQEPAMAQRYPIDDEEGALPPVPQK